MKPCKILIPLLMSVMLIHLNSCRTENIVLRNSNFRYEIDQTGKNLHFIDRESGTDYLCTDTVSYFASVKQNGKVYNVTSVTLNRKLMKLEFGNSGVNAVLQITRSKDHIILEVKDVKGEPESFTFMNIPLSLEGMYYEPFASCVLSLNLFTHVHQLPALQTHLQAVCYSRTGMKGARIALIGVPQKDILPVIRKVLTNTEDIPHSDKGGAWALMAKEGYGSYLMNTGGSLTEETVDEWIELCQSLGFNQIDNHGGGAFFRFGDFEINKERFPDGWDSFKRINKRLRDAGISSILHTYSFFIDKTAKYVTPVPSEDLGYFNSFTLAESVNPDNDEIVVNESTADISATTGFWVRNSNTLRIGSELVQFSGVTKTPPYKFTGLTRGALGTKASNHNVNEKAFHLMEMFNRFVPGSETELFKEIARRTAEIVDECNFDGIYFDAADGSDLWGGEEFYWYYGPKFVFEVARNLKTPVGMEMAGMTHNWWHYRSRWQAWDSPVRGFKRFVDIHLASIKSDTYPHGEFLGHSPVIDKLAKAEYSPLFLPLHLGWWRNIVWNPSPQIEMTFPDDIEYLGCKMIGNNAGLSIQGVTNMKTIEDNPLLKRLHAIMKQYEELRHKNYFSDSVRELLRQPGKEYTLFQEENGNWNFKPVVYNKHKVTDPGHESARWVVNNQFDNQPVKLRIQPLMSVKSYNDPSNVLLTDFSIPGEFSFKGAASGVTGELTRSGEVAGEVKTGSNFSAHSSGVSPREDSWIYMEKKFDPWLNLDNNQALGVWIKGDGNGQLLNLRIGNPEHIGYAGVRGDHFVKIDFTGWRYFELVEIESTAYSDYIWEQRESTPEIPESFNVYNSYKGTVRLNSVDKLQIWYNNLPAGKEVNSVIGTVKALPMVPVTIENPAVTINGKTIVFPVKMESGMYLEFKSDTDCKLYGHKGELIQDVKINGEIPVLKKGVNEISFNCEGPEEVSSRVEVTVIGEGEPL